jgi:hypothetical protein
MSRTRRLWSDPLGLVGWVFADLLLALFLVFLAVQPGDPNAKARAAGGSTSTTTTTTTTAPAPTTTTVPPGVDQEYLCFRIQTNRGLLQGGPSLERDQHVRELAAQVVDQLRRLDAGDRRAGIVLAFGVATIPNEGRELARVFNELVLPEVPDVFSQSAVRNFWDGAETERRPGDSVAVNLYPLTDGSTEPLPPSPDDC